MLSKKKNIITDELICLSSYLLFFVIFPSLASVIFGFFIYLFYFNRKPWISFGLSFLISADFFQVFPYAAEIAWIPRIIFTILSFLIIFSPKVNFNLILKNKTIVSLLTVLLLFCTYQIFVSSFLLEDISFGQKIKKVFTDRLSLYFGCFYFIPTYLLALKNRKFFYYLIVYVVFISLILFFSAFLLDFDKVYIKDQLGSNDSDVKRLAGYLRECAKLIFICFTYTFFTNIKYQKANIEKLFLAIAIFTIIYLIFNMSRMLIIHFLALTLLSFYYSKLNVLKILKFASYTVLILLVLLNINVIKSSYDVFKERLQSSYNVLQGQRDDRSTFIRFVYQIPTHLELLSNSPIIGLGLDDEYWKTEQVRKTKLYGGLADVPLTANIVRFGILGMIFFYFRYVILIRTFFKTNLIIKNKETIFKDHFLDVIFFYSTGLYILGNVIAKTIEVSMELAQPSMLIEFGIISGLFLATNKIINQEIFHERKHNNNRTI